MLRSFLTAIAVILAAPSAANAQWREAISTNFIAYSDGSEKDLRERVESLERFGLILQAMTGARRPKQAPVKIKIYFVRTINDVQETMPFPSDGIAGYYAANLRSTFAVMPRQEYDRADKLSLKAKTIIQHELTHHFMYQYFPVAYPTWYSEGFADYAGMIEVDENSVAKVGLPLENRMMTINRMGWLSMKKLLTAKSYADVEGDLLLLYAEGWLLVHYLNSTPAGRKQLGDYLMAINAGKSFEEAASALGDLDDLDRRLRRYANQPRLNGTATAYQGVNVGEVKLRALSPAENALVMHDLRLSGGIPKARMPAFVAEVRGIAGSFADDPYALRILTEAERLAGNRDQAIAAAARWQAVTPRDGLAHMHRGMIEIEGLQAAKNTDAAAWTAARAHIVEGARLTADQPQILKAFYDSYAAQGRLPPASAQNALAAALDLVPQEDELRVQVALDYEQRGLIEDAIHTIRPLAYSMRSDDEMTPRQKSRRDKLRAKYAMAGDDPEEAETPHEILARLEKKLAEKPGGSATGDKPVS